LIKIAHGFHQQVKIHRLGNYHIGKVVEVQPLFNIFGRVSCDQNNRYVRRSVCPQTLDQFGAVHIRHAEIGDDYKGMIMLR
jgi:hypothetical protein